MTKPKPAKSTASDYSTRERSSYYRDRNEKLVTFQVDDPDLKRRLKEVAEADDRSVNSWITKYIVPLMEEQIEAQESKKSKGR